MTVKTTKLAPWLQPMKNSKQPSLKAYLTITKSDRKLNHTNELPFNYSWITFEGQNTSKNKNWSNWEIHTPIH